MQLFPTRATLDDKIQYVLIHILRLTAAIALVVALYQQNLDHILNGSLAVILLYAPDYIERRYKVRLPIEYSFSIILFLYASLILGGILDFYAVFPWWDDLLHASFGVLLGFAGFIFLYILKLNKKLQASQFLICVFALSVAVTLGTFWEIFEYSVDALFNTSLQRGATNADTSRDLITDSLGALFSVILSYRFMSHPDGNDLFSRLVNNFMRINPRLRNRS